jgi:hypothetical protein
MHQELVAYLRAHAYKLIMLARRSANEDAAELETLAIELLERVADLERSDRR